jgi:hypothetical protein
VAELDVELPGWPEGIPGDLPAWKNRTRRQLRLWDINGYRQQVTLTNLTGNPLELERRQRLRDPVENCIKALRDTGLDRMPFRVHRQPAAGTCSRLVIHVDRLLLYRVSVAALLVVAVHLVVVLGLGREPGDAERRLLVLSMVAAAVTAGLYLPTRRRLSEPLRRRGTLCTKSGASHVRRPSDPSRSTSCSFS